MYFLEFANVGVLPAEFQLALMQAALRALAVGALTAVGLMSLAYFLILLAGARRQ